MTSCTFEYKKGYYIHASDSEISATCSPTGYGYTWRKVFKSVQAAKIGISKHFNENRNSDNVDEFTRHYAICALWSSNDGSDDSGGSPMDENYNLEDVAPQTWKQFAEDCEDFQKANKKLLAQYAELYKKPGYTWQQLAGHDFWLTRCGHGAGFWDRGIGEVGDKLAEAAKIYGNVDLHIGDDGKIYSV